MKVVKEFWRKAASPSCHPSRTVANRFVRTWPRLTNGSLGQTASRSVQPFLQGSLTWSTDWQTDYANPCAAVSRYRLLSLRCGQIKSLKIVVLSINIVKIAIFSSKIKSFKTCGTTVTSTTKTFIKWNIWNSLPIDLRVSSLSAATFARHLKACLFRRPS